MKHDHLITHLGGNDYLYAGYAFTSDGVDLEGDVDTLIESAAYQNDFAQSVLGKGLGSKVVVYNDVAELKASSVTAISKKTLTQINNIKNTDALVEHNKSLTKKSDIAADIVSKNGYEAAGIHKKTYTMPCGKILAELN